MVVGQLPVEEQLGVFREALARTEVLMEVLARSAALALPGWYLTAGCVVQTIWNTVTRRAPGSGIKDYDLFYFDGTDLSWEAEDAVIRSARSVFADLPAEVEVRNEARVHLWYESKFGLPCPAYTCTEDAIDSFAATTCSLGVRVEPGGRWRVYAPHGFSDVFNLVVRPNPVLAPQAVYEAKASRWLAHWPELTVLPWPTTTPQTADRPPRRRA
ncbi:nucleotidyltransferase family protein [Nocardia sp. IFM 10818]